MLALAQLDEVYGPRVPTLAEAMAASPMEPFDRWLTMAISVLEVPLSMQNETHLAAVLLARAIDGRGWRDARTVAAEIPDVHANVSRCAHVSWRLRAGKIMHRDGRLLQPLRYDNGSEGLVQFALDAMVGGGELLCIAGKYRIHPGRR